MKFPWRKFSQLSYIHSKDAIYGHLNKHWEMIFSSTEKYHLEKKIKISTFLHYNYRAVEIKIVLFVVKNIF